MRTLRIGLLLGFRQLQRASLWTNLLIVFVMALTFLNLIAVSGVLVGLITGAENAVRENALGDIIISPKDGEDRVLESISFVRALEEYPEVKHFSVRYQGSAVLEANYRERRNLKGERDVAAIKVTGIDPIQEDAMSDLSESLIDGEYLDPEEEGYILIGAYYVKEYSAQFGDIFETIETARPGDTVRLTAGDISKEFIVKGIIQSKVDDVTLNTYIPEREFRRIFNRVDRNADQIVVKLHVPAENARVRDVMLSNDLDQFAKIQTFEDGAPKFIQDIKATMNTLGTFIGSIGLVVASITIFIIIFINAVARRRYIGILKGIGIDRRAIEIAYVFQAGTYALVGSLIGATLTYGVFIPYFEQNPIKFPFSDGILVAEPFSTFIRFLVLFFVTLIAGYLPAWMIVRGNTLNAILGRK